MSEDSQASAPEFSGSLPGPALRGEISVPGDKSISHRAIMFSALAEGESHVSTSCLGRDNLSSIRIMRQLGVSISGSLSPEVMVLAQEEKVSGFSQSNGFTCEIIIQGKGFSGLSAPVGVLDCGNSGTAARLLTGILAGRPFSAELTGDETMLKRPFKQVVAPLTQMGANFNRDMMPFCISGHELKAIDHISPQASAQVKSAVILAGLQANGTTTVTEPHKSRDHTERMLQAMGCNIEGSSGPDGSWKVEVSPLTKPLSPLDIIVPGDFSAAAFFIVAATIVPESKIRIKNIGFNPTRIGLFELLQRMGADIEIASRSIVGGEEVVDLDIKAARLRAVEISGEEVVKAIDEVPILTVAMALAEGTSRISGAEVLRTKESDRLAMSAAMLKSFSCEVEELPDGLIIHGKPNLCQLFASGDYCRPLGDAPWRNSGDHRIAMSGAVLEYFLCGDFCVQDRKAVETSFPSFVQCFQDLICDEG